jgi:quercetin dioxygenase-like cupin family protein
MPFFDFSELKLQDFRPGIKSAVHLGEQMTLAVLAIDDGKVDEGHAHPFEQCGLVLEGAFSLTIAGEPRTLGPGQGYFVPAGVLHGWSTENGPVRVLDLSAKPPGAA